MSVLKAKTTAKPLYLSHYALKCCPFSQNLSEGELYGVRHWQAHYELLGHLIRFSQFLLVVVGQIGVGKSTFIRQFAAHLDVDINMGQLDAKTVAQPEDLLIAIASALGMGGSFSNISFEHAKEQFFLQIENSPRLFLLIVDDADIWPAKIVQTLFDLIITKPNIAKKLHVLLSAKPTFCDTLCTPLLKKNFDELAHVVTLLPLTTDEIEEYILWRLNCAGLQRQTLPMLDKTFNKIVSLSNGLMGQINTVSAQQWDNEIAQLSHKKQPRKYYFKKELLPKRIKLLFNQMGKYQWLSLGGACLVIVILVFAQPINEYLEPVATVDAVTSDIVKEVPEVSVLMSDVTLQDTQQVLANDIEPLFMEQIAPVPTDEIIVAAEPARVEITSAFESEPLVEHVVKLPEVVVDDTQSLSPLVTQSTADNVIAVQVEPEAHTEKVDAATTMASFLLAKNPAHYTLQLLSTHNEDKLQAFIARHAMADQLWYARTHYQNTVWFVLLYGDYPSKQAAQNALNALPIPLKQLQPWPRMFAHLQQSMQ